MTKKDYVAIGHALQYTKGHFLPERTKGTDTNLVDRVLDVASRYIANAFKDDNPSFDRERFLRFVETGKDTRSWGDD
jgi:hypothetical protein